MAAIIVGDSSVIQTSIAYSEQAKGNGNTVVSFFNIEQAPLQAKAAEMRALGYDTNIRSDPPGYILECSIVRNIEENPVEEEPENVWELTDTTDEQNLLEADTIPLMAQLSTKDKAIIEYRLKNNRSFEANATLMADWENRNSNAERLAPKIARPLDKVYTAMAIGVTSKQLVAKELSRSITVSNAYNLNTAWLSLTNNKVVKTETLLGLYPVPANIAACLPQSYRIKLNAADDDPLNDLWCTYGWLDCGVQRRSSSNGNYHVSQHWRYNRWIEAMYEVV